MVTDAAEISRHVARVRFDERGLAPCVMQDSRTGEVLTLAYINEEALRLTLETGEVHLYSRSRQEIWRKGDTSGDHQVVHEGYYDCDADTLLFKVQQLGGGACHTGSYTCFSRRFGESRGTA